MIGAVVLVPKIFPKNNGESSSITSVSTIVTSNETSVPPVKTYTLSEMIGESDNVLLGTVIKANVDENGVLYTLNVTWSEVYKGRNYSTMGYAYVNGDVTLEMAKTYLFIGDTNEEKYHYKEPFEKAPWVFLLEDDKLTHTSNGDVNLVTDLDTISLEEIKIICKNQSSSK